MKEGIHEDGENRGGEKCIGDIGTVYLLDSWQDIEICPHTHTHTHTLPHNLAGAGLRGRS